MITRLDKIEPTFYAAAKAFAREVRAFAIIESDEQPYPIGDAGEAFGLLQIHPALFKQYYGSVDTFPASVKDTWIIAEIKTCASFLAAEGWTIATSSIQDLIIQAWNLGIHGVFDLGQRNPDYLARWKAAYASLQ